MEGEYGSFTSLKIHYAKYVGEIIQSAMVAEYGDEAFAKFVEFSEKQVAGTRNPPASRGSESFADLDWQACNTTFRFLSDVKKLVFSHQNLDEQFHKVCTQLCTKMSDLRNILSHEPGSTDIKELIKAQLDAALYMDQFLSMAFVKATDENSLSYAANFHKEYLQFSERMSKNWYFLSDYLTRENYNYERFPNVCIAAGIECRCDDGRLMFRSADIGRDLNTLKNNLAYSSEINASHEKEGSYEKEKPKNKKLIIILVVAVLSIIFLSAMFSGIISAMSKLGNKESAGNGEDRLNTSSGSNIHFGDNNTSSPITQVPSQNIQTQSVPSTTGENQIKSEHQSAIKSLKYGSDLALQNQTLTVRVGEYVAPPSSSVWLNGTIYSEDTSIAVGEDTLVKGISKGETYIIYESKLGTTAAYRVVVK